MLCWCAVKQLLTHSFEKQRQQAERDAKERQKEIEREAEEKRWQVKQQNKETKRINEKAEKETELERMLVFQREYFEEAPCRTTASGARTQIKTWQLGKLGRVTDR